MVETLESVLSLQYNHTVSDLSVQEVLDCSYTNHACQGGSTCLALQWLNSVRFHLTLKNLLTLYFTTFHQGWSPISSCFIGVN